MRSNVHPSTSRSLQDQLSEYMRPSRSNTSQGTNIWETRRELHLRAVEDWYGLITGNTPAGKYICEKPFLSCPLSRSQGTTFVSRFVSIFLLQQSYTSAGNYILHSFSRPRITNIWVNIHSRYHPRYHAFQVPSQVPCMPGTTSGVLLRFGRHLIRRI